MCTEKHLLIPENFQTISELNSRKLWDNFQQNLKKFQKISQQESSE